MRLRSEDFDEPRCSLKAKNSRTMAPTASQRTSVEELRVEIKSRSFRSFEQLEALATRTSKDIRMDI